MIIKDWNCTKQGVENQGMLMRNGVVMAVNIKITVPWDAMPCQLVASYQHLRRTSCLHLQGTKVRQQGPLQHQCQHYRATGHCIPEAINIQGIYNTTHSTEYTLLTMLERAVLLWGTMSVISNVALIAGSSQQGKQRLASVASNWVTPAYRSSPSGLQADKGNHNKHLAYHVWKRHQITAVQYNGDAKCGL